MVAGLLFQISVLDARADWQVATFRTGAPVPNLARADALIAGSQPIAVGTVSLADFVGFNSREGTGHFDVNNPVPGISSTRATDNYAVRAVGVLLAPSDGDYTFGLNTDDGARLRLDGVDVIVDDQRAPPHDSRYVTVFLTQGQHDVEWTWYNTSGGNSGGGAVAEIFAAEGRRSGFDAAFKLVGDPTGLRVQVPEPGIGIVAVCGVLILVRRCFRGHGFKTAEQIG